MDRQKTSVFSDYDPMENSSLNSKQLQNWLKQQSSCVHSPKFGAQWTLMMSHSQNVSSRYQQQQVSFAKHQTYQSVADQNNSLLSNTHKTSNSKSKSYVNAMQALQKRVKSLQSQNEMMKKSLQRINEQKSRSMSQSFAVQEQLRCRLQILEPKTQKLDELISQNKMLRQTKQQKVRRVKVLQRSNQQNRNKYQDVMKQLQKIKGQNEGLKNDIKKQNKKLKEVQKELQKMFQKNQTLEDMKQKSTTSLFQKYNKSIEWKIEKLNIVCEKKLLIQNQVNLEQLSKQNPQLYHLIDKIKRKLSQTILINLSKSQAYEKRDQQFVLLVKSQHKKQEKQKSQKKKLIKLQKQKQKSIERQVQHKSQIIQLPHSLIPVDNKKVLDDSEQSGSQLDLNQSIIPKQTKSVGKPIKRSNQKSNIISSSNKRKVTRKQDTTSLNTQQKKKNRKKNDLSNSSAKVQNSNVMKSCQAAISHIQEPYILLQSNQNPKNSYYYTAYPPIHNKNYSFSNYHDKKVDQFCERKNDDSKNLDKMMLVQIQKQLLDLYDEQQNLIMASNDELSSQNQRSEYLGRLKQIHQQIRIKNQKACELKAKV